MHWNEIFNLLRCKVVWVREAVSGFTNPFSSSFEDNELSVRYNTRELNKICSGNLYPFSPESIMEHILAPTNEAD